MGERNSLAECAHDHAVQKYIALTLLFLGSLFLTIESHAMSADESALKQRLPTTMRLATTQARSRIMHWQTFIDGARHKSVSDKIIAVNAYFNTLHFVDDQNLWHQPDYWATPLQMLAAGAGDCEDFAIAKYYTLKMLGINEDHLRITYVWNYDEQSGVRQPHMILIYTNSSNAEALVLDIVTNDIRPLKQHKEMEAVYGLNSKGLWFVGEDAQMISAGTPTQLPQWRKLVQAMEIDTALLQMQ